MNTSNAVERHYGISEMPDRLATALRDVGWETGQLTGEQLAPLDQFHTRGLAATKELAEALHLAEGDRVLDVGSGLGGPARYLATVHGANVVGIELTPMYVEIAQMLSERTGLGERTRFVQGDAQAMPFASEEFDHAWTQHVAMNIADKDKLYREINRVLKTGGRLAIYDVVRSINEPVIYPVPWAFEPSISFLASRSEMVDMLTNAGFRSVSEIDATDKVLEWFAGLPNAGQATPVTLGNIIGGNVQQAVINLGRNLKEDRAHVVQMVFQKE